MRAARLALAGAFLLIVTAAAVIAATRLRRFDQPIAFNHSIHVNDNGMQCLDCHVHAGDRARATIPNIATCEQCHAEALGESAAHLAVTDAVTSGERIPWIKVTVIPDNVFFSHRRHVTLAEIACETCHDNVGERTAPLTRPLRALSMPKCIACHEERGASNDCLSCHR